MQQPQYGPQYGHGYAFPHPPPPDPPELPEGASPYPGWPAWYGPAAMGLGLGASFVLIVIFGIIAGIVGGHPHTSSPAFVQIATLVQDAVFVGAALVLAARTARPRTWQFGLGGARFWSTIGWMALAYVGFVIFEIVYSAAIKPSGKQNIVQELGARHSTLALVTGAVLVIVIAPVAEEFFFRGFFYRSLRTRMGVVPSAVIVGVVFGAIHYDSPKTALILPVLGVLGFIFCLVYERTGTLFSTIGLHAINNSLAYGVETHRGGVAAIVLAVLLSGCLVAARTLPSRVPRSRRAALAA
ncbi:MAG: CPBP family intramembrane metalloprotease [Actinobacteria bacterium]|nr:CPBP family intramembrane metalloprotease [Actinomycetota bacterium]